MTEIYGSWCQQQLSWTSSTLGMTRRGNKQKCNAFISIKKMCMKARAKVKVRQQAVRAGSLQRASMATSRADKNATEPLHLSSSSMSHPFPISSILTLYSPNMRPFIQHRSQPESSQLAWCMTASHPPLEEIWPQGFVNDLICATQITLCTLGHRSSFETGQCARKRTHNGMANLAVLFQWWNIRMIFHVCLTDYHANMGLAPTQLLSTRWKLHMTRSGFTFLTCFFTIQARI